MKSERRRLEYLWFTLNPRDNLLRDLEIADRFIILILLLVPEEVGGSGVNTQGYARLGGPARPDAQWKSAEASGYIAIMPLVGFAPSAMKNNCARPQASGLGNQDGHVLLRSLASRSLCSEALSTDVIVGFISGMTGAAAGVFLALVILAMNWGTARQTAATTAVYNLMNSAAALHGAYAYWHQIPNARSWR